MSSSPSRQPLPNRKGVCRVILRANLFCMETPTKVPPPIPPPPNNTPTRLLPLPLQLPSSTTTTPLHLLTTSTTTPSDINLVRTMRRVRTNQRTRAPSHVVREKLLARVLAAAKAKRNDTIDAKRAARFLSKRRLPHQLAWSDDSQSHSEADFDIDINTNIDDDLISTLLEAIEAEDEAERRQAERRQLEQLERLERQARKNEDADLDELLAFQSLSIASHTDTDFVKCPNCPSGKLIVMNHGSVVCTTDKATCGLRVNSGAGGIVDAITPEILRTRFAQVHQNHAQCHAKLAFETKIIAAQEFLVAKCAACATEDIVL